MTHGDRPRELRWYHAGPILFGDWGTSRLYVLGLCFLFNRFASLWYMGAMSILLIAVGISYIVACRLFPNGGGVYSAAKPHSQLLAVIGALLLCADFVVTAALSALDAFHYLGLEGTSFLGVPTDALLAAISILLIGGLNIFGPTKMGTLAIVIALATVVLTLVIGVASLPHLGSVRLEAPTGGPWRTWIGFTEIVLALSGVEAIVSMTGIMVQPVEKTARRSMVPVMIEIVILNLILTAAMTTLPDSVLFKTAPDGTQVPAHTGDMLRVIAEHYVGPGFAAVSSFVFAALLLSAVNTAIGALVSVLFMLSRDREMPASFAILNRYGMPVLPLVVALAVPAFVVLLFPDVEALAGLYAIGIVGAIALGQGAIAFNRSLTMKGWERGLMIAIAAFLVLVELTICVIKPHARGFALIVLVVGLCGRLATLASHPAVPLTLRQRRAYQGAAILFSAAVLICEIALGSTWLGFGVGLAFALATGITNYHLQHYRERIIAWKPKPAEEAAPKRPMMLPGKYKPKSWVMVATQGNPRLIKFALEECKSRQAELQLLFIRHIAVTPMGEGEPPKLDEDEQAQELFERVRQQAQEEGVPLKLLYGVARDIPDAILDMAMTHGASLLLLGSTRRGTLWKAMKGDVIQAVAEQLPESVGLLIHA
jgi:amino acid transporter/nucleotide-binding universal stress UspA family protein